MLFWVPRPCFYTKTQQVNQEIFPRLWQTSHSCAHLCVVTRDGIIPLPPGETPQQGEWWWGGVEHWSLNAQFFLPVMTTSPSGRRRTKRLKWIYGSPDGGRMCRRWSDDNLCSPLKWNMTARELSAISCLAQEAPIWSWVLSVLRCCVAWCCNSSCHCCCRTQHRYYFWSTTQVSRGRLVRKRC